MTEDGQFEARLNMFTPVWHVWDWHEGLPVARYPDDPGLDAEVVLRRFLDLPEGWAQDAIDDEYAREAHTRTGGGGGGYTRS